ncbi:MAG: resistance to Congo red protein [Promethearchaeota archaeon]
MQRIKSLDSFRGFIMLAMVWVHLCEWWLREEDIWFSNAVLPVLKLIFGPGFLLLAGVSVVLFYKKNFIKITLIDDFNYSIVKKEYLFRATFILIIAIGYNSFVALQFLNPLDLWKWFMLLTMSISLFIVWPLLKVPKFIRVVVAVIIWILNYFVFNYLLPYQGQTNINGLMFYILYNSIDVIPFPHYFSFLLIGTFLGEVLFNIYQIDHKKKRNILLKKKITVPSLSLGVLLIIISVTLDPRLTLERTSFIWIIFAIGINLILLSIFLGFEDLKIRINKRRLKFLFYYSYYSLTLYLAHNLLYFFFLNRINLVLFWILVIFTCFFIGFLLRLIYNKYGPKLSIKVQVGRSSSALAKKLETI